MSSDALTAEATELLQQLIRNACVNDGRPESGGEQRNAETIAAYLSGAGFELERYASVPGRDSLVARIEGSDPGAPTLCLMGHTDVVPAHARGWREDPFGGELIDGEVWGRGAVDMLNITATMAVALKALARSGFRPTGTLIYLAVADEEAGGRFGAEFLVERHWDAVGADYVLTETGGWSLPGADGRRRLVVHVAEKGIAWRRLRVLGTPGHGSRPYGADNALVTAAEVVRRLAQASARAQITELWRAQVAALALPEEHKVALLDPDRLDAALAQLPPGLARHAHATTRTTYSPNVVAGGQKANIIPDEVVLEVDIRTLPGTGAADVDAELRQLLGEFAARVEIAPIRDAPASASPVDNVLFRALEHEARRAYPDAALLPAILTGGTDARFYRERGAVGLGAALYSESITAETFASRFHGQDERVDVASLGLSTALWMGIAREVLAAPPE